MKPDHIRVDRVTQTVVVSHVPYTLKLRRPREWPSLSSRCDFDLRKGRDIVSSSLVLMPADTRRPHAIRAERHQPPLTLYIRRIAKVRRHGGCVGEGTAIRAGRTCVGVELRGQVGRFD